MKKIVKILEKIDRNPLGNISNLEDYCKAPKNQRMVFGVFYRWPSYIEFKFDDDNFGFGSFEEYFKKNYPVQYFFREYIPSLWRDFISIPAERAFDWVRYLLFPRQRWLYKKLPRGWRDKSELIPIAMFEMVIHFVEEEKAGEVINWGATESHSEAWKTISNIYRWAKLRKKIQNHYWRSSCLFSVYDSILDKFDDYYLKKVIEIRGYLWV